MDWKKSHCASNPKRVPLGLQNAFSEPKIFQIDQVGFCLKQWHSAEKQDQKKPEKWLLGIRKRFYMAKNKKSIKIPKS